MILCMHFHARCHRARLPSVTRLKIKIKQLWNIDGKVCINIQYNFWSTSYMINNHFIFGCHFKEVENVEVTNIF